MTAPPAEPGSADRGPRAAVVIPVRGGLDRLAAAVGALAAQDLGAEAFEVIVVDDGTPAGVGDARAIAHAAGSGLALRVLRQEPAGPAAARNRGIDAAAAPIVALLDADVLPRAGWLRRGLEPFDGPDPPAAVEGRTVVEPAAQRTPFTHQTDNRDGGRYPTCNLLVDRSWIVERGIRFDERYPVPFREDSDFAFQILASGGEIRWHPAAEVVHPPVPRGWATPLKLARRYEMDGLLRSRFPQPYAQLDPRLGVPHLRQRLYGLMAAAGIALLLLPIAWWIDGSTIEAVTGFFAVGIVWTATTLALLGGRPTLRSLRHAPAAAAVTLLVPLPWAIARLRGRWRFRGVEPHHPRTVDGSDPERRRSADPQPPAPAGG
ncbi:glycosyltransferase [Phycisphaera mikurensis]|uniref:Putative glycosyltransferase n=1 Tax=Phycisphaera mikurensis (strain NBRC 102666 / KCTC 22515 / FYK2301M01) TaxID=1142394 RepID=I0IAY4_PHYMF|nr:glycosyltransferase [Phycisphaera mikurensis]MBB6442606.1 glycosyltransferase involved in cell wall biosynthesis [Phycisphaera mikurensis]BAM02422.1 putative glycosyltransferase [Phycisphaera mikurensis NBRC 102666]